MRQRRGERGTRKERKKIWETESKECLWFCQPEQVFNDIVNGGGVEKERRVGSKRGGSETVSRKCPGILIINRQRKDSIRVEQEVVRHIFTLQESGRIDNWKSVTIVISACTFREDAIKTYQDDHTAASTTPPSPPARAS